jgi:hypothetical protein
MQGPATFGEAERRLKAGRHLSGEQLAALLDRHPGTALPDLLRTYIVGALRGRPHLPAGRKARIGARWDFTMADTIDAYEEKRRFYRAEDKAERARARAAGETLPRTRLSAHERAADDVLQAMKADLGNMIVKRLLNIMSEIKKRDVPEEDEVGPEDVPDDLPDIPPSKRRRV